MNVSLPPFAETAPELFKQIAEQLSAEQLLWLSGYSYGLSVAKQAALLQVVSPQTSLPQNAPTQELSTNGLPTLTMLYGTHTGNSKRVALRTAERAQEQGFGVVLEDMRDYAPKRLKQERYVLLIVSTHGEGEPPMAAEDFYKYIHSPRAPKLVDTRFSVLALGDKSYLHFCKTGADMDAQLENLGAMRLVPRVDCDVDFDDDAERWITSVLKAAANTINENINKTINKTTNTANPAINGGVGQSLNETLNETLNTALNKSNPLQSLASVGGHAMVLPTAARYSKKQPFAAPVLEKIQLNGRGSVKETYHLELGLEESGIVYEPGDALGVIAENSAALVEGVVDAAKLSSDALVSLDGTTISLYEALQTRYELTVLTRHTLQEHAKYAESQAIQTLLADASRLQEYLYGRDVLDVLHEFPVQYTPETLLATLRKLPPRLYSIASSLKEHEREVHLTVAAVRYETPSANGTRRKQGLASCFLADRVPVNGCVKVFVERNEGFKLPAHPDTDIIMVGPGTGIAPFRAFVEERAAIGATGRNWLFFGNPHFTTDFLYQTEWQQWLKKGVLTKLNVAFSRDQPEKLYVQHKLLAQSKEVFEWLEQGASFYVCGDKNYMAKDVEAALRHIVQHEAGISAEHAAEYVHTLKKRRRYLEDVY